MLPQITALEIERRLDEIRSLAVHDPHAARLDAVRLLVDTLRTVAAWGSTESRTIATAALQAAEIAGAEDP